MELEAAVSAWVDDLTIRGLAGGTISLYRASIKAFIAWCDQQNIAVIDIELSDVRSYLLYLTEVRQLSSSTVRREIMAVRSFMSWAEKEKIVVVNNVRDVKLARREQYLPNMMDIDVVNQMIDQPPPDGEKNQHLWVRDRSILEVFYSSGLRLSELRGLRWTDVDYNAKTVRVLGKGNKVRVVPLGSKAIVALKDWMEIYRLWNPDVGYRDWIYVSESMSHLSTVQIYSRVKHHAKRAGIQTNVYPHLFRHCFATHMLMGSGDIRAVQEMLGHSDIGTTQIYAHLDVDHLMSIYDKTHPRANK